MSEEKLLQCCERCHTNLEDQQWKSEFVYDFHYKTTTCPNCKKTLFVKVSYDGSGHDDFNLEKRLG